MSLRYQFNLGILLVLCFVMVIGVAAITAQTRSSVSSEVSASVNLAFQLIQLGEDESQAQHHHPGEWLRKIAALEQTRHVRFQLRDTADALTKIGGDSAQDKAVSAPRWFVWAVESAYPGMTYRFENQGPKASIIQISADPSDEINEAWQETKAFMGVMLLMGVGLFIGVNLTFRQALKSVTLIVQDLDALEYEHPEHRLPSFRTLEFARIAGAINRLAEKLGSARDENNALMKKALRIQENERRLLAQELHDELGQSLTAIKVMATAAQQPRAELPVIHRSIVEVCDQVFQVARAMMKSLHPLMLEDLGLKSSLQELIANWTLRNPTVNVQFDCPHSLEFDADFSIQVYRVVQECVTNAFRHADPRSITVKFDVNKNETEQWLHYVFRDDGKGCEPEKLYSGFGLKSVRARIQSLGGQVVFGSNPGQGVTIQAAIPVRL